MARPRGSKDTYKRKLRSSLKSDALVGKKVGRWSVIEKIQGYSRSIKFKVKCDCGTEKTINYSTILNSNSCGCLQKEIISKLTRKPNNGAAIKKLFNRYLFGAQTRNLSFNLTEQQVYNLSQQNCYYCGIEPSSLVKTAGGQIKINGIDRVDNDKGYAIENCVACCSKCNYNKHDVKKFIIEKCYEFFKRNS